MGAYRWRRFDRTQGGSLYLDESDACLYYMDKTSGRPSDSEPNQLIYNLKISPADMTDAQRMAGFKDKAIRRCADDIADLLNHWATVTPENTIPDGIRYVLLVDDQLTKGTHFKAVKPMFEELGYAVAGVFWAKEHFKGVEYGW